MWRVTAKGLWAKKLRLLLTSLSVVLGVAFVSGSFVLTDTISGIFDGLFEGAYANTDTAVRSSIKLTSSQQGPSPGTKRETIPKDLVTTIRRELPSTVVEGRYVQRYAQIFKRGKAIQNTHAPTFGTVWGADPLLNSVYKIDSGHPPRNGSQVAVDEGTAERHDLAVGDKVSIGFSTGAKRPFTISGVFRFGDAGSLAGATMASFDPKTSEEVLGAAGQYDLIVVRSTAGLSQQELTAAVAKILPPGASAVTGKVLAAETASELQKNLGFFNIFLLVFAFIALFVGMFIIYNTFSIIVAQRSKELALLRAIGASGRQVMRSVAVEALATGVVSSLLGIAAGIGLAITLKATFGAAGFSLPDGPTVILPRTLIVSFAAGVIVTFVSAIFPAPARCARSAGCCDARAGLFTGTGERALLDRELRDHCRSGSLGSGSCWEPHRDRWIGHWSGVHRRCNVEPLVRATVRAVYRGGASTSGRHYWRAGARKCTPQSAPDSVDRVGIDDRSRAHQPCGNHELVDQVDVVERPR